MIKVYTYRLGNVIILDKRKGYMYIAHPINIIKKTEKDFTKKQITHDVIEQHIQNQALIISPYIIKEYAPKGTPRPREAYINRRFVGRFSDYEDLKQCVVRIMDAAAIIRNKYTFDNFFVSLWDAAISVRRRETEDIFNYYGRRSESELALWHNLRGKVEFDFLPCPSCFNHMHKRPTLEEHQGKFSYMCPYCFTRRGDVEIIYILFVDFALRGKR